MTGTRHNLGDYRTQINNFCIASMDSFRKLGTTVDETAHGPLIHLDRGSSILGVAHLDTVGFTKPTWTTENRVSCMQLDDRLGAWVLMRLLPALGCPEFDILFTDSEESGQSTADTFKPDREYNWVFEFDRAGTGCVLYEYEDKETRALIEGCGWDVQAGAFSDICSLSHLKVKAFNFGTGYHSQHTTRCYAEIPETLASAERFVDFAKAYGGMAMPHTPQPKTYFGFGSYGRHNSSGSYSRYNDSSGLDAYDGHGDAFTRGVKEDRVEEVRDLWQPWCSNCFEDLDTSWKFCPACGLDMSYGAEMPDWPGDNDDTVIQDDDGFVIAP